MHAARYGEAYLADEVNAAAETFTAAGVPTSPTISVPNQPVNPFIAAGGNIYVGT